MQKGHQGLAGAVVGLFLLVLGAQANAVVLDVDTGGNLLGASGVVVGSQTLDVSFVDGTCGDLFGGCTTTSADFFFSTQADAEAAAQALLDQVLLDVTAGRFDSDPELTRGCDDLSSCQIWTPYSIGLNQLTVATAQNRAPPAADQVFSSAFGLPLNSGNGSGVTSTDTNLLDGSTKTWAVWSATVVLPPPPPTTGQPLPAPSTLLLAGLGLACFSRAARRRLSSTASS